MNNNNQHGNYIDLSSDEDEMVPARQAIAAISGQNVLQNTRANERGASTSAAANQSMNPALMGSAPVPAMVSRSSVMPSNPQIGRNSASIPSCSVVPEKSHERKPVPVTQEMLDAIKTGTQYSQSGREQAKRALRGLPPDLRQAPQSTIFDEPQTSQQTSSSSTNISFMCNCTNQRASVAANSQQSSSSSMSISSKAHSEASHDCLLPSVMPSLTGGSVSANEETREAKNSETRQALREILEFFKPVLDSTTPHEPQSEPVQQNSSSSTSISSTTQSTVQRAPSSSGAHNKGTAAQKDREPTRMSPPGALSSAKPKPTTPGAPKQLRISDFGLQDIDVEEAFHQEIRKQELQMIWQEDPNNPGKKMMVLTPLVELNAPNVNHPKKDREQEELDEAEAVIYGSDEDSEEEDGDDNLEVPPKKLRLANETRHDQPKTVKDDVLAMDVDEAVPVKDPKADETPKNYAPVSKIQSVQKEDPALAQVVVEPRTPTASNGPEPITVKPRTSESTSSISMDDI